MNHRLRRKMRKSQVYAAKAVWRGAMGPTKLLLALPFAHPLKFLLLCLRLEQVTALVYSAIE